MRRKIRIFRLGAVALIFSLLLLFSYPQNASADALTALSDTMSRLADSTPTAVYSDHTIKYTTPSGIAAGQNMQITFPSGFTIGSVDYTDIDVSWGPSTGAENELTLAAAASGATWGAVFSGQVLSITSGTGTITAASKVIIEIGTNATFGVAGDQQIQNQATAATYTISIAGSFGDTGKIAIVILTDDQVQLTATVNPSITFSISATSSAFGELSTGSVTASSPDITLTVGTNAQTGYTISVQDQGDGANPGLYNTTASYLIGSANPSYGDTATLSTGNEGYGIQGASATATIAARYDKSGNDVGGLERTATTLASYSSGMTGNHTVTVTHKAAISSWTKAGSYSDTLTYIATGNF